MKYHTAHVDPSSFCILWIEQSIFQSKTTWSLTWYCSYLINILLCSLIIFCIFVHLFDCIQGFLISVFINQKFYWLISYHKKQGKKKRYLNSNRYINIQNHPPVRIDECLFIYVWWQKRSKKESNKYWEWLGQAPACNHRWKMMQWHRFFHDFRHNWCV